MTVKKSEVKGLTRSEFEGLSSLERTIDSEIPGQYRAIGTAVVFLNLLGNPAPNVVRAIRTKYKEAGWKVSLERSAGGEKLLRFE